MVSIQSFRLLIQQNRVEVIEDIISQNKHTKNLVLECIIESAKENNIYLLIFFLTHAEEEINSLYAQALQIAISHNSKDAITLMLSKKYIIESLKKFDIRTYEKARKKIIKSNIENF